MPSNLVVGGVARGGMLAAIMKMCGWLALPGALAAQGENAAAAAPPTLAIEDVTVLDVRAPTATAARLTGQTVLVEGRRISWVGPASEASVPAGVRRIDGSGKFVIPGLLDMHVHFNRDTLTARHVMAPLMIANGVTGARDMVSDCWEPCSGTSRTLAEMRKHQAAVERGDLLAPRLLALSSPVVHGRLQNFGYPATSYPDYWRPTTAEQGRELVHFLADRGVDLIKIYTSIPRHAFFAIMDEAKKVGLPVAGHLPWAAHPSEASDAGMTSIEHARWPGMACNPGYAEFRTGFARVAAGEEEGKREDMQKFLAGIVPGYDPAICREIVEAFARNGTTLVPTLLTRQMDARAADSAYRDDPRRKYVPAARLRGWDRDLAGTAGVPDETGRFFREFFDICLEVTGMAHAAGVRVLVGTDVFDTMVFPGFSYHDELRLLRRAGLEPLAVAVDGG